MSLLDLFDSGCVGHEWNATASNAANSRAGGGSARVSRTEVCDMIRDGRGIRKFNEPLGDSELEYEGGVPATFKTLRKATVAAFASLLDRIPVIFIRAPPLSGKTALCDLLYDHIVRSKPDALVPAFGQSNACRWQVYRVFQIFVRL
ncbi:hypothetical protein Plhal703r1_c57g0162481 [Plasmopara halstedii]